MYRFTTIGFEKSTFQSPVVRYAWATLYCSMKHGHIRHYTMNQNRLYLRQYKIIKGEGYGRWCQICWCGCGRWLPAASCPAHTPTRPPILLLGHAQVQATPFDFVGWRVRETRRRLLVVALARPTSSWPPAGAGTVTPGTRPSRPRSALSSCRRRPWRRRQGRPRPSCCR